MPLASFEDDGNKTLAYSLAGGFWLGIILGFAFLIPVGKRRRADVKHWERGKIGIFRFFRNVPAIAFDILLIIGILIILNSLFYLFILPEWITLTGTITAVFSLEMHGMLNGKNFAWLYGRPPASQTPFKP